MGEQSKRLHPLLIPLQMWHVLKKQFFIITLLYVLNFGTEKVYLIVLQIIYLLYVIWKVISIILNYFTYTYQLKEGNIQIKSGFLSKSYRTVPLHKIQNVQQRTTVFHKLFHVTSLTFETGIAGDQSSVLLEAISLKEAKRLETEFSSQETPEVEENHLEEDRTKETAPERTIHFTPTKRDVLKASFTSLSFLAIIPVVATIYQTLDDFFNLENAEGAVASVFHSWITITIVLIIFVGLAIGFGIVSTYLKYGKYEISSDTKRIYIKKGVLDESAFSIQKEKVQAVEISQSLIKRMLGLAEVKLISAGNTGEEELETNTLYPFLSVDRAYAIIEEILPSYQVKRSMQPLSKQAFIMRMIRPSYVWILVTVAIIMFKPAIWYVSCILFLLIYTSRIIDHKKSRYLLHGEFIQFKTGGFQTSLFITNRSKVIQVKVQRSRLQKHFGLASIETVNRSKPVHHTKLQDVSLEFADEFYTWYTDRTKNIEVQ